MKPCPDTFPFPLVALDETASTNQYLSQLCNQLQESVAELTTVTAEFQTAGKGQRGNTWEAEEGKNLLFSFVLYPSFLEARRQFILSQIVSLAIKEELSRWSDEITIKWPNDIYWKDKKICGILIENDLSVAELTTVTAEFQTAGKGQRGNTWEAEEGKNLLFSFVLYPSFLEARRQFILSQIVSLAIKEELSRWSDEITIKWPNDIYWKDKKICGILIENDLSGHHIRRSIAGIGININQEVFNSDAPNPVSLKQITGKEHDRYEILAHILRRVQIYYNSLQMEDFAVYSDEISTRYARSLFRRRGLHPYEDANGKFLARLLRVEQDGRFVLEDEGGSEREYLFKEVQYIL